MVYLRNFLLIAVVIVSCKANKPDINLLVNNFSEIECRSISLRTQRFILANKIRYTQDTLIHTHNYNDTSRLNKNLKDLSKEKENILGASLVLADSIKKQLDRIFQNHLADTAYKTKFNRLLNTTLKKKGCLEKENME